MYYIAYGSNINLNQMNKRCPNHKVIGVANITDYKLMFQQSVSGFYLNMIRSPMSITPAVIYDLDTHDVATLDRYEGCPNVYSKIFMHVKVKGYADGHVLRGRPMARLGFAYVLPNTNPVGIPSEAYMMRCLKGYEMFGFDPEPLYNAWEEAYNIEQQYDTFM